MTNLAMKQKLIDGEAIDVSLNPVDPSGYYILSSFEEDKDYCDGKNGRWIWSIGRRKSDGVILASMAGEFYQNKEFECLWLR